jgi:serine protease Do
MVKIFGAGGFTRLNDFGTGIIISPDGHILTVANTLLDSPELLVHLYDGRRMKAVVLAVEPELDAAVIKIVPAGKQPLDPTGLDLSFFDIAAAAKRPPAQPGDWVLGFSNQFKIAYRDEPVSVQRGVIAAYASLDARKGGFDFPYTGKVYVVDAITNNPGAEGGALTDRQGNLLGIIGREIRNKQTDTWINYAIPVHAVTEVTVKEMVNGKEEVKTVTLRMLEFIEMGMKADYKAVKRDRAPLRSKVYTGIQFVPNVLPRTPAYIDAIDPDSPASRAGLKPDDLIAFVDGEPVISINAFNDYLEQRTKPGTTVRLEVRRGGGLQTVELTIEAPKAKPAPPMPSKMP